MADYTPTTDFSAKDALPTGDPNKIIKGSDFDVEFGAIETAIATKVEASVYSAASGSSLVGYDPGTTGDVDTTVQTKLREIISVKDFGATGDGVTDDSDDIRLAWTAAGGEEITVPKGDYVFSGTYTGGAGDLAAATSFAVGYSPLGSGTIGRTYHYNEPVYDLASNVLSVDHYYRTGTITIPTGKQHNVMRFDGVITGGTKFKGIDFNYVATDSVDAYCAIGLLQNSGSGATKALYGRTQALTGCTGIVAGLVSGITLDSGVTVSVEMGVQISMDGTGSATESSALRIDTNETTRTVGYGVLSLNKIQYANAMIKGFNDGAGDFLNWATPAGLVLFEVVKSGDVHLGSTSAPQRVLNLYSDVTNYIIQGVSSGNYLRITDNTVGRDVIKVLGGSAGNTNAVAIWVGGASKTIEVGANDSGGTGYKMLRVTN